VTINIEVLRAMQRKRERSFQDFWLGIEGKRSYAATVETISLKFAKMEAKQNA